MKKILIIAIAAIAMIGCKKTETKPAPQYGYGYYPPGTLKVTVTSNYLYPFVRIEQGNTVLKYINWGSDASTIDPVQIDYQTNVTLGNKYGIYVQASKNYLDTTKNMTDGNKLMVHLIAKITSNGFDYVIKDTVMTAQLKAVQHSLYFKIQ